MVKSKLVKPKQQWIRLHAEEFDRRLKEQFYLGVKQGSAIKPAYKESVDSAALEMVAMVTQLGNANAQLTNSTARMLELCKR